MKHAMQQRIPSTTLRLTTALAAVIVLAAITILPAQAQTFTVLHSLSLSQGSGTIYGLVADRAGNLYGSAYAGGISGCPFNEGCGTVFKLSRHGSGWIFSVLYSFTGVSDGWWPQNLAVGPDGSIYGTTSYGGLTGDCIGLGCGTVFRLQPPPTICPAASCSWQKTTLHKFSTGGPDGRYPNGPTVDAAGNVYGTTNEGGENGSGTIWELSPSNGSWTFQALYQFNSIGLGSNPLSGVGIDASGNLWGSGDGGNSDCGGYNRYQCGALWELVRSGSGWNFDLVYNLDGSVGGAPLGVFTFDSAGNMYGTLSGSGPAGNGGVFQYVPSTGQINLLYAAPGNINVNNGPQGGVTIGSNGNLYAADPANGAYGYGYVFQLTPSNGNWIYTDLYDFGSGPTAPYGPLVVDSQGNVYGAAGNAIFEIAP
jgi:hypothetical protein